MSDLFKNFNGKIWLAVAGLLFGVVLVSHWTDNRFDEAEMQECVARNMELGASSDLAIRLCALQLAR